ncbi:MAG: hypothetical protein MUF18_00500 [Fimbriiglobus sp.]|jgi:hypothetical protein|nr:hypothetical protein [Fimbriiglobus sp.]
MSANDTLLDDETVLRHIPGGTTWQAPGPRITSKNFELRAGESGISVSRAGITSPDALMARLGDPAKGSRIASGSVAEVRALGLEVIADPKDYDQGHALICPAVADLQDQIVRRQLAKLFQFTAVAGN